MSGWFNRLMSGFTGQDPDLARNTLFPPDDPAQIWRSDNPVGTETTQSVGMPQPTVYAGPIGQFVNPATGQMTAQGRASVDAMPGIDTGGIGAIRAFHGTPGVRVYHGTRGEGPVTAFNQEAAGKTGRWTNDADAGMGFHFTEDPEIASGYGQVSPYDVHLKKPLHITEKAVQSAQDDWLTGLENSGADESLVNFIHETKAFDNPGSGYYNYGLKLLGDEAKAGGHDGMIFSRQRDFGDDRMVNEYIVFDPAVIRPALDQGSRGAVQVVQPGNPPASR